MYLVLFSVKDFRRDAYGTVRLREMLLQFDREAETVLLNLTSTNWLINTYHKIIFYIDLLVVVVLCVVVYELFPLTRKEHDILHVAQACDIEVGSDDPSLVAGITKQITITKRSQSQKAYFLLNIFCWVAVVHIFCVCLLSFIEIKKDVLSNSIKANFVKYTVDSKKKAQIEITKKWNSKGDQVNIMKIRLKQNTQHI